MGLKRVLMNWRSKACHVSRIVINTGCSEDFKIDAAVEDMVC